MSLSEVELAYFLPLLLVVYWLLPRRAAVQNAAIVVASLFFYATWSLKLLPLFVVSTAVDYAVLRGFARWPVPEEPADPESDTEALRGERAKVTKRRQWLLAAGVLHNLGALFYFKYVGFFTEALNQGLGTHLHVLQIALPLGLSFYTMGRIGVLIDTYYDRIPPVRSPLVWFSFVSFFPQLIAGPIGRGSELYHQYEAARRPDPGAFSKALGELATGFFLKVYVAAQLGSAVVDPVFKSPGTYVRSAHVLAVFGYGAQVFADFAGYSLIAIGVGRLLGITLPDNFDFPFLSTSPPEVWRRWHMSLNRWLFDYIYGPMVTGESFMRGRIGLGFVVVMLASGLWHGAAWTFVLWGLLHGLWLLVHYRYDLAYKALCRKDRKWVARRKTGAYKAAGWVLTIGFFLGTLVPFRSKSLGACGAFFEGLLRGEGQSKLPPATHLWPALLAVVLYHVLALRALAGLRERAGKVPFVVRGAVIGAVVVFLFLFAPVGAGTFIYAQF